MSDSKEAFEKFYRGKVSPDATFDRSHNGQYRGGYVQYAWFVWQAAQAQAGDGEAVNQQLLEALDKLVSVAEMCDSWESFPSKALDEARAAIAAAQEHPQDDAAEKYSELIYAVETKHPNESRHETALRHIRQAESSDCQAAAQEQQRHGAKGE